MRSRLVLAGLILFTLIKTTATGQNQTGKDSSLVAIQMLLSKSETQRLRDSIKTVILQEELQRVKRTSATALTLRQEIETLRVRDSIRLSHQAASVDSLRQITVGAPVQLLNDTLFYFYTPMGPFTSKDRAENASSHVHSLYELVVFHPDSIRIQSLNNFVNLSYGQKTLLSLHETDAVWANATLDELAIEYKRVIGNSVSKMRDAFSLKNNLIRAGKAALILVLAYLFFLAITKSDAFLKRRFLKKSPLLSDGLKFHNYQVLTDKQLKRYLLKLSGLLKISALSALLYITVYFLFKTFPVTQSWTETLSQWIWEPIHDILSASYHYLPKFVTLIVLVVIARYVSKTLRYFSLEIERGILEIKGFHKEWARPTYIIVRFLWYAFMFVLIFPYLPGSDSTAFKGVSVFLGILFSIGSSSAISNTIAGFVITYMRPFRVGDWIKVTEITGQVIEKTFLVTRIRTINHEDVTVPNSAILAGHTINYSSSAKEIGLIVSAQSGFIYSIDWNKVHDILRTAALSTTDIDTSKEPFIFHTALNDFYALYQVNAYTQKPERMYFIQSELYRNIQIESAKAGVDMMIPHPVDIHPPKK